MHGGRSPPRPPPHGPNIKKHNMEQEKQREAATANLSQLPHLPNELLNRIFKLAADDPKTAHALAYVSRAACALSAPERWRVVTLTSIEQYLCFCRALAIAQGDPAVIIHTECTVEAVRVLAPIFRQHSQTTAVGPCPSSAEPWHTVNRIIRETVSRHATTKPLSLPSSTPGQLTRHFYFDADADAAARYGEGAHRFSIALYKVAHAVARTAHALLPDKYPHIIGDSFDAEMSPGICPPTPDWTQFSQVQHLSLGLSPQEPLSFAFRPLRLLNFFAPRELTTGCHDSQGPPGVSLLPKIDRLRKVHFFGVDPLHPVSGLEVPVQLIHQLRAGSVSEDSFLGQFALQDRERHGADRGHRPTSTGVTHVRYDTRAFALRPANITAGRLAPLLREVCVARDERASIWSPIAPAPPIWSDYCEEAQLLRSWGIGSFERLHLAWALPPEQKRHPHRRDELLAGGWPREAHDVWTDSSQRPYASDDVVHDSFASELQDAIWSVFGWQGPLGNKTQVRDDLHYDLLTVDPDDSRSRSLHRVINGDPLQIDRMNDLRAAVRGRFPESRASLQYGVRAPSTLIKLGGTTGAFTRAQRLELFWDRAMGGRGAW